MPPKITLVLRFAHPENSTSLCTIWFWILFVWFYFCPMIQLYETLCISISVGLHVAKFKFLLDQKHGVLEKGWAKLILDSTLFLLLQTKLSFQMWTSQMQDTLNSKKHGDNAFRLKDFGTAIDYYSQVIHSDFSISIK